MNPIYVQVGVTVATILGSGVVSVIISHHFTERRAERDFRRKKAEELFLAFHGYCTLLTTTTLTWLPVMKGQLTYDEGNEKIMKITTGSARHYETTEMLIALYFPTLESVWREVMEVRDQINATRSEFKKAYLMSGPDESFTQPLQKAVLALDAIETRFKQQLTSMV